MARLFEVREFAARKRALAAESEAYRQMLRLELQNFRFYAVSIKRRLNPFRHLDAVLPAAGVAASFWLRRKQKRSHPRPLRAATASLQVYQTVSPLLRRMARRLFNRRANSSEER